MKRNQFLKSLGLVTLAGPAALSSEDEGIRATKKLLERAGAALS